MQGRFMHGSLLSHLCCGAGYVARSTQGSCMLSHLCCEAGLAGWSEAGARGAVGKGQHKSTPFSQALHAECFDASFASPLLQPGSRQHGPASRHKPWMNDACALDHTMNAWTDANA
jgi:hypothetical protein